MRKINFVKLDKDNIEECIRGWIGAFPHWKYADALKCAQDQVENMCFFGAYEDGIYKGLIVGAETSFNFRGSVFRGFELDHLHVEPLYRKTGISKFLIQEFQKYAVEIGHYIINVGPFSTAFYRNMGYGFGSKVLSFMSAPVNFQYYPEAVKTLEYFDGENRREELETFIRVQRTAYHGSFNYKESTLNGKFKDLCDKNRFVVLSIIDNKICGVINYESARKIVIDDFLFTQPLAIQALSSYLHSLNGNIESVKIRHGQPAVLAICNKPYEINLTEESMVKLVNVEKFIQESEKINFTTSDIRIKFKLLDSINDKPVIIDLHCENGYLKVNKIVSDRIPIEVNMNLSDFTTMLFSQVGFKTFVETGLAKINDNSFIQVIHKLFAYEDTPYNI